MPDGPLGRSLPPFGQKLVKCNQFDCVAQCLQLSSKHVDGYRWNDFAPAPGRGAQPVIDQDQPVAAQTGERT